MPDSSRGSLSFELSPADWKKIGTGAALAVIGGLTAWFSEQMVPMLREQSSLGLLIATVVPIALNIVRKFLMDTRDA